MPRKHVYVGKASARVLYSVLLVLTFAGLVAVQIVALLRIKSLTAEVADLNAQLLLAKPAELPPLTLFDPPAKSPPKPERTPAEREAIHALALTKAVTDMASEKAFFSSYDVYELSGMVREIEEGLRSIIGERPPHNQPSDYWWLSDDEEFKKYRADYVKRIRNSLRKHALIPASKPAEASPTLPQGSDTSWRIQSGLPENNQRTW